MGGPTIALLALLSGWVSQMTGLPLAPLPQVELTGFVNVAGWQPMRLASKPDGFSALATVHPGRVYLHPGWQASDIGDICVLAHELVHVAQYSAGIKYKYVEDMEPQAYDVQRRCTEAFRLKWTMTSETLKRLTTHHD